VRLDLVQRIGRSYDLGAMSDVFRQLEQQVNDLADGRISARDGAMTASPASGNWVKGDFVPNSNPAIVSGSIGSYLVLGWVCTTSGSPGTWKEARVMTADFGMSPITNSLSGNVNLNNTGSFFTGPAVTQGTSGTWFFSGTVTFTDTAGAATINAKLTDGTTVIASAATRVPAASVPMSLSLSGYLATPAGNVAIQVNDATSTSGVLLNNSSGGGKDSTLTAIRIA
jgi:hypothetical protein